MNLEQNLEKAVVALKALPIEEQQEILVVLENEIKKHQTKVPTPTAISALEAARPILEFVGEGPSDLSANPQYMDGYGQS